MARDAGISGTTRIMGMIGDPVAQVQTPQVINRLFAEAGADIRCVPLHVPAAALAAAMAAFRRMDNVIGFGVTLPHKVEVMPLCDRLDPAAQAVGAVNVIRREADGAFCGYQFDGRGFVGGLAAQGHDPRGQPCLVLGAGGAAAAVVMALAEAGAGPIRIANRTLEKAEALARRINALVGAERVVAGPAEVPAGGIVVNATALGMALDDPLPVAPDQLGPGILVAEVVAKPEITALLTAAAARGAAVHSGIHMIRAQVPLIAAHLLELHGPAVT